MKKLLISLSMMCLGLCSTQAEVTDVSTIDNVIYLTPVTANAGSRCVLSVQMKNVAAIAGYQFYLSVPNGITFAKDEENFLLTSLSEARTTSKKTNFFDSAIDENGFLRVVCGTSAGTNADDPSQRELYTFSGNDGEVCTVTIDIPSDFEAGTYPLVLSNIVLSNSAGDKGYETERVETTLTVEGVSDGRIKFDENATSLPSYTAGQKGNVRMTRTIKAGQWSTIVLPFTLTKAKAEAAFGDDVQLAEFSGFETVYADEDDMSPDAIEIKLTTYTMTAKKGMTGGKPFLIKTSKDIENFEADEVTLFDAVTDVDKSDEYDTPGKLTGTFTKTTIPADGLFINSNKFWYSTGKSSCKAFRCWFELGAVLDRNTDFGSRIILNFLDGETMGIKAIQNSQFITDDSQSAIDNYYDLKGLRMDSSRLKKGVYVKQGKKVVVR